MTVNVQWSRVTDLFRTGCKGPAAGEWLRARSLPVPSAANTWAASAAGDVRVARLGNTEFFVEGPASVIATLDAALITVLEDDHPGVYPVLRADAAFLLEGTGAPEVLAQVCNVNFASLDLAQTPIIMTLMIGVGVLVLPQRMHDSRCYRIWCDPSFGEYLDHQLSAITAVTKVPS